VTGGTAYIVSFTTKSVQTYTSVLYTNAEIIATCASTISYGVLQHNLVPPIIYKVLLSAYPMGGSANIYEWAPLNGGALSGPLTTFGSLDTTMCTFTIDINNSRWFYLSGPGTVILEASATFDLSNGFQVTLLNSIPTFNLDITAFTVQGRMSSI
jgi:hypothetical protein